jgi:hypothetical protein
MKIILTESQNESLKNKLMNVINSAGFEMGITVSGSFNNLLNIIGKDNLYDVLVKSGFDPSKIEMLTSKYDIPSDFYTDFTWNTLRGLMNYWGPMYLLEIQEDRFLFQQQNDKNFWIVENIGQVIEPRVLESLSLKGLDVNKVIDLYFIDPYHMEE